MHLETGRCAQCNSPLSPSADYADHNKHSVTHFPPDTCPLFCKQACVDKANAEYASYDGWDGFVMEQDHKRKRPLFAGDVEIAEAALQREKEQLKWTQNYYSDANIVDHYDRYRKGQQKVRDHENEIQKLEYKLESAIRTQQHQENIYTTEFNKLGLENFIRQYQYDKGRYLEHQQYLEQEEAKRLEELNKPPPPPVITYTMRFEHTHILGPSGSGKTTLVQ
jgi:flagellar biosynthesis GTPase FlhF